MNQQRISTIRGLRVLQCVSVFAALFSFLLVGTNGCAGGGSAGTGTTVVQGVLRTNDLRAIPNAVVAIAETGKETTTDDAGEFSIETDRPTDALTIEVQTEGSAASVEISEIPEQADLVQVELNFSGETSELAATSVQFFDRSKDSDNDSDNQDSDVLPSPIPSATNGQVSGPSPSPTPSVTPDQSPSASPSVAPSETPAESPTPTASPSGSPEDGQPGGY